MLDVNTWSKFYWENPENHWKNLAQEINRATPYEAASHIAQKIKKINNDYFQECSELSLGYYPTVDTENKYKKLKKSLGEKLTSINLDDWINQLKQSQEKGNIFFYYFQKQIQLENATEITDKLENYDASIVEFLQNKIILENNDKNLQSYHMALNNHLTYMIENEEDEKINFVINFYNKENQTTWFKKHLNHFLSYRTFLLYVANVIEYSEENIQEVTHFLNNNAEKNKLIEFNTNILAYIESFSQQERLFSFVRDLPLDSYTAFTKIVFGDITTEQGFQKWYDLVVETEKTPKHFLEKVWQGSKDKKGMKIVFTIEPDAMLLDFIAEKMIHVYSQKELEKYDFNQSIITNNNIQEIMQKKLSYYYLNNKLSPHNKKSKKMKI